MTHAHYRLTSDEFLTINSQLTNAQLRVYLHYKTLDPFGDRRVEICTKAIAEALNLSQRSVQRCLNKLASMGLLVWEKAKSFIMRHGCRHRDTAVVKATSVSSKRQEDRERQLELSLDAGSEVSQSSSILFNLDHDQEDLQNSEILKTSIEDDDQEISVEDALAEIRSAIGGDDDELCTEDDELCTEDDELCTEPDQLCTEPDQDEDDKSVPEEANATGDGRSFRRRVEDFVLKTLGKSPKNRAAYFAKFSKASWQKWEADYRASLISPAPYKPYVPEKVEVAAPDSPVAQSAIAFIKQKLGMK